MEKGPRIVVKKLGTDCVLLELLGWCEGLKVAEAVTDGLTGALQERRHGLVDLGRCDHMDRPTLQAIVAAGRRFDQAGDLDLLIFAASEPLREVLEREIGGEESDRVAGGSG